MILKYMIMDWPRLVLINEECGSLAVAIYGGEVTRNINQIKKSDVMQLKTCSLCGKYFSWEYLFSKDLEYCE